MQNFKDNIIFVISVTIIAFIFSFSLTQAEESAAPTDSGDSAGIAENILAETVVDSQSMTAVMPDSGTKEPVQITGPERNDPSVAPAAIDNSRQIDTAIIRNLAINKIAVIAVWQMSAQTENAGYVGADNSTDQGAQFLPSGQFEINNPIAVCALIGDESEINNVQSVEAAISYPQNIAIHEGGHDSNVGCGRLKTKSRLNKMNFDESYQLVCDRIRNNNNNLIKWNMSQEKNIAYSFEQVCGQEGYLANNTTAVYCEEIPLAYNDPAGIYQVKTTALGSTAKSANMDNEFTYQELTTFETDFSSIQYGPVKINDPKILKGDLEWGPATGPTVRNTGNTRLRIKVWQNDFGLGKTDVEWNITYQARVGDTAQWIGYSPEMITELFNSLDIGETANMDFGALIKAFPDSSAKPSFWGSMTLSADKALSAACL